MGDQSPTPEFGPRGYLPERASKRARKIVLRAPLGLQWIVAAVVFGLLVLVAGVVWLNAGGPPGAPFVAAGPVSAGGPSVERVESPDVWLVLGTGPVLAVPGLSLIHISEPTRPLYISYAVFCLKKKK